MGGFEKLEENKVKNYTGKNTGTVRNQDEIQYKSAICLCEEWNPTCAQNIEFLARSWCCKTIPLGFTGPPKEKLCTLFQHVFSFQRMMTHFLCQRWQKTTAITAALSSSAPWFHPINPVTNRCHAEGTFYLQQEVSGHLPQVFSKQALSALLPR